MSTSKEIIERVNWISAVILVIVLSFIGTCAIALNGSVGGAFMCRYAWGIFSMTMGIPIFSIFLPLLVLLPSRLGLKINTRTLATLYIAGMVVSMYGITHYEDFAVFPVGFARTQLYNPPELLQITSTWWWMPSYDIVKKIVVGGVSPEWDAWVPSITFWWIYYMLFFLLGSSLMMLFRRRWIDVEKVPFPYVLATYEALKIVQQEGGEGKKRLTPFIIGLLVGLIFEAQIFLTYLIPWWPDLLAWRLDTTPQGCVCIPPSGHPLNSITSTVVHPIDYTKNLLPVFIYYLAPLDITFTAWVFIVIMAILEQVAYTMGYYTGVFQLGGGCKINAQVGFETSPPQGPPFYWMYMCGIGGTLAMAAMVIYHSRSYLAETIRAALQGRSKLDEEEPFSYRTMYILMILSTVLILAFFFSIGLRPETALAILIVSGFINTIASAYAVGLTGSSYIHFAMRWPDWPFRLIWPTAPVDKPYDTNWLMSHAFIYIGVHYQSSGLQTGAYTSMHNMKMSNLTGTSVKGNMLLMIVLVPIAVLVAFITRTWIINLLGIGRVPIWGGCDIAHICHGGYEEYNYAPPLTSQWGAGLAGFIIVAALSLIRTRFIWWPLHPIGFLLATGPANFWLREWNAFLEAWIAKYLTIRIGGSKLYEEYGIPFVGGGVAGIVVAYIVAYLIGIAKFFIPF